MEDSGRYTAIAKNETGTASTSCNVTVTSRGPTRDTALHVQPPTFSRIFQDMTVTVGYSCDVSVVVTGNPVPKVTRNGN